MNTPSPDPNQGKGTRDPAVALILAEFVYAGLRLSLAESGVCIGPAARVRTHCVLVERARAYRSELAEMMRDPKVESAFSDEKDSTPAIEASVRLFLSERGDLGKRFCLTAYTLIRQFYPWAHERGDALPTSPQLCQVVDGMFTQNGERIVSWEGIRVRPLPVVAVVPAGDV